MRPTVKFLETDLIEKIISEARDLLCTLGIEIQNQNVLNLLNSFGAKFDKEKNRVYFTKDLIDNSLKSAAKSFSLFDVLGNKTHDFSGFNVHFTPGSSAVNILDPETQQIRKATSEDYIKYTKIISQLNYISSQSTAFIANDVPENIQDVFRLYLSLLYCEKPVITGAFNIESFEIMKDLQLAVRGNEKNLKEKPLTIFSCCPSSPLKWNNVSSQNLIDCAKYFIPVEYVPMPLLGFISPVTIVGTLIQHTAEVISGIIISQCANPGTPALYGGSPAVFDYRNETTPMGAIETMMVDCANNEIGKYFGLPTQAYISLSDAKYLDAQAGYETATGATLAVLSGINNISGPGMMDFENCISLEKLVLDNEICGSMLRLIKGITPKEDFPSIPLFQELLSEKHLLIADHTRKYLKEEIFFPNKIIERANREKWIEKGSKTVFEKAKEEIQRLINSYEPSKLSNDIKKELKKIMLNENS